MKKKRTRGWDLIDMTGRRYGRLVAVGRGRKSKHNRTIWRFRCDCGNEIECDGLLVRQAKRRSCGCLRREARAANGQSPMRRIWRKIVKTPLQVCQRWRNLKLFIRDVGRAPETRLYFERIDETKPYGPKNWHWKEPRTITVGKEAAPIKVFADRLGCSQQVIEMRLRLGWPEERAATEPVTGVRLVYRLGTCPRGHDWTNKRNVAVEADGTRRCLPCRKLAREARP